MIFYFYLFICSISYNLLSFSKFNYL